MKFTRVKPKFESTTITIEIESELEKHIMQCIASLSDSIPASVAMQAPLGMREMYRAKTAEVLSLLASALS